MKRAKQEEERCRRTEFQCKLYGIIKDLDRSMKSECNQSRPPPGPGQNGGLGQFDGQAGKQRKPQGAECCCPPGCCQQSMEFRMPKLLPKDYFTDSQGSAEVSQDAQGAGTEYNWHNEDHSWGCRPVGEGGPGSQRGGGGGGASPAYTGGSPNSDYGSNIGGVSPTSKCGEGSPNFGGGGCCTYKPISNVGPNPSSPAPPFQFPKTPEEAIQRGCFVARSA